MAKWYNRRPAEVVQNYGRRYFQLQTVTIRNYTATSTAVLFYHPGSEKAARRKTEPSGTIRTTVRG